MNERIRKVLDCFEPSMQSHLLDFCMRISKLEADVFVLMARKASCFFNCLEELGLIHFNGYVTSERILDMNCEWLKDKKIVIIDDAIVSGTSINRTIEKLNDAFVKSIEVHVLTVNSKWFQKDMLTDINGKSYLYPQCNVETNEKCIELCYNVVKSILIQPRPYDIDFPYYNQVEIKEDCIEYLLNKPGWDYYEITSIEQKNNNIFTVTILPTREKLREFEKQIKCDLLNRCLVKIRIYGTFKDKNKRTFSLRIVPMIVFDKMLVSEIMSMYSELMSQIERDFFDHMFISETSKLRLMQFYFSNKFAEFWVNDLPEVVHISKRDLSFEDRNLSFIFPEEIDKKIGELCKSDIGLIHSYIGTETKFEDVVQDSLICGKDFISLESRLIEPFINKYYEKELPCRELVLREGKDVFKNSDYEELLQRLNKGITVNDMMRNISYAEDCYDIHTRVSLFIDRAIDMGMIVPITQVSDGYVFRAFRHGEDVLFGKREEILYLKLLHDFQNEAKNGEGITHISAEKMIVLFSKIGIKKGFLQPYLSNFTTNPKDNNGEICKILRVKTYLKGPVALVANAYTHKNTKEKPYITEESKSIWFTNTFIQKKGIVIDSRGMYHIPKVDTSSITPADLAEVENIAILFGEVCNPNTDTGITFGDDELTKVATCLSLEDCVKAVAAELSIFSKEWEYIPLTYDKASDERIINERKNCKIYEALNSAYMKLNAFELGAAKELLKNVKFSRKTDQNLWEAWFDDILLENRMLDVKDELNQEVQSLFDECKFLVLFILYAYHLLSASLFINYKFYTKNKRYAYLADCYEKIADYEKKLIAVNHISEFLGILEIESLIDLKNKIKSFYPEQDIREEVKNFIDDSVLLEIVNCIENAINETNIVLEQVCCVLGEQGHVTKMNIYNQVLAIPFEFRTDEERDYICDRIDYCYRRSIDNLRKNHMHLEGVNIEYLSPKCYPDVVLKDNTYIVWLVRKGNGVALAMAKLALNIVYCLNRLTYFQVIYFGDISYKYAIKKSENRMSDFLCNSFYGLIEEMPINIFQIKGKDPAVIMIMENKIRSKNQFIHFINNNKNAQNSYKKTDSVQIEARSSKYIIENYETRYKYNPQKGELMMKKDIGIITILQEEAASVVDILNLQEENFKLGERLYYSGYLEGDRVTHSIVMTQQLSQGEVSVVSAYNDMVKKYNPQIIFLVGIAGGITKDVDYCSVVLGRQIISYDLMKDTPTGIQRRGDVNKISSDLLPLYQRFLHIISKTPIVAAKDSLKEYIHIAESNIASGSAVIENELSEIKKWIHNYNDKTDAVEMEAYGLSSAFYEGKISDKNPKYGICVIRGISDLADTNKGVKKEYRIPAAKNAAIVLREFIKIIPKLK